MDTEPTLATVLFTDIVGSTERAAELGDRGWRELLAEHHSLVRREIRRFGGIEAGVAGDGFLATFDRPARAVRCACVLRDAVRDLGLEIRSGVHVGEVEGAGADLGGIAVHIGARVGALAGPGEVLVSSTVREALTGSGFGFQDRGIHVLKGVPGEWRLHAVARVPASASEAAAAPEPAGVWGVIRRARLVRTLAFFLAAALLLLQVVRFLVDELGLPDWLFPGAIVLLLAGLPIILATALVQSGVALARGSVEGGRARGRARQALRVPTSAAEARSAARHWLTWRKAIVGGVLAFAMLGLAVTAYMTTRALGIGPAGSLVAAGVLEERGRILIADFENHTADSMLGVVVTEALRVDLAQSPLVTVVQPQSVAPALERMRRPPGAPLDVALAREVAVREGIKAVLAGDVGIAGSGYVLSTQLLNAESGEVLAGFRRTAADSTQILDAINGLSKDVREKAGESLKTIRASEPLDRVTTGSLEALRKYTKGLRALDRGEAEQAIALLDEAVAIDSGFAMAWRKLGVVLSNYGIQPARAMEAVRNAYAHRDRLTDRERYLTLGTYYAQIGERAKSNTAYRTLLDTYPDDAWAINNLGLGLYELGDYAQAESLFTRALELDPSNIPAHTNLIETQVARGKLDEAQATLARFTQRMVPGHPVIAYYTSSVASLREDFAAAEAALLALREQRDSPLERERADWDLANLARLRGKLSDAEEYLAEAIRLNEEQGRASEALSAAVNRAWIDVWFRGDTAGGLGKLAAALVRHPLQAQPLLDRPYLQIALFYAEAGEPARARGLVAEHEAIEPDLRRRAEFFARRVDAAVALAEGRPEQAIDQLRRALETDLCPPCPLPALGRAYERAGQADSALAVYARFVARPFLNPAIVRSYELPRVYERLGELYAERGDATRAREAYQRFVDLWKEADPELQPRVQAARQAIRALVPIRREAG